MNAAPLVTIVHLALKSYGLAPFRSFVDSYRQQPAGTAHRLVIALKGFRDRNEAAPFLALLDGVEHTAVDVPDGGLDIGTYRHIAQTMSADIFLFFNSRTVIDAPNYARKLLTCINVPGVGAVAATGSWQSLASDRRLATHAHPFLRQVWKLKGRLHSFWWLSFFPPYPNPHLRTNGLMIRRDVLNGLRHPRIRNKMDAMRFESGWNSLSRQLVQAGLDVRVVDREGTCWGMAEWPAVDIFWAGRQARLMIKDNQTELYAAATSNERATLNRRAWMAPATGLV